MATVALVVRGRADVNVDAEGRVTSAETATATWNASRTVLTIAGESVRISTGGGGVVISGSGNVTFDGSSLIVGGRRVVGAINASSASNKRARLCVSEQLDAGATIGRVSLSGQATLVLAARASPVSVTAEASGQSSIDLASLETTQHVTISASGQSSVRARMPPATARLNVSSSGQADVTLT